MNGEAMPEEGPPTYAVVVAYHSEPWLLRCLQSLRANQARVLLVDNGGMSEDFLASIRNEVNGVRLLPYQSNMGFAGGNNFAWATIAKENFRWLCLFNPDAWMEPETVAGVAEQFERFPEFGVLAPLQLKYDDGSELADWTKMTLEAQSMEQVPFPGHPIEVAWVEGSALFIRREIVDQLGLFDPVFDMYFEEVDLCRRVRRAGWKVGIVPSVRYHHAVGTSLGGKDSPTRQLRKDLGQILYVITDPGRGRLRNGIEVLRLLGRRAALWAQGGYPLFPQMILQSAKDLIRKRRLIVEKWHRERRIQPHRESR